MKRLFDITFSLVALVVFAAPACMISLLLRFMERHPVFFFQARVGEHLLLSFLINVFGKTRVRRIVFQNQV